jgi:hypothetical protein
MGKKGRFTAHPTRLSPALSSLILGRVLVRYIALATIVAVSLIGATVAAQAASVSGTLTVVVAPPALAMVINPSNVNEACEVPAGAVVSQLSATGGDGNPVTFSISGGDTTDFAINGANVVVGPNGIAKANCGASQSVTVTASQQ